MTTTRHFVFRAARWRHAPLAIRSVAAGAQLECHMHVHGLLIQKGGVTVHGEPEAVARFAAWFDSTYPSDPDSETDSEGGDTDVRTT